MAKKFKTFCNWSKKDIENNFDILSGLLHQPKYTCKKCARASNNKKALCKPIKIAVKSELSL